MDLTVSVPEFTYLFYMARNEIIKQFLWKTKRRDILTPI